MTSINIIEEIPAEPPPLELDDLGTQMVVPDTWHPSFTAEDKEGVTRVIAWLNQHGRAQSWLARASKINVGTFNQVLHGKYASSPSKQIRAALDTIGTLDERQVSRAVPFVDTCTVFKYACSVYHRVRVYRTMGVFICEVGTGKTSSAKEYRKRYSNTLLVECLPEMTAAGLLEELGEQLNLQHELRGASTHQRFKRTIQALTGTEILLILDEAEELQPAALEYIRRIRDIANVGVVLQGAPKLQNLIKPNTGKFNRIRSRIGFWPEAITQIDRRDAEEIIFAAFPDQENIDKSVLDTMWEVCGGSARVLTEQLIPNLRDYGLRRGRTLDKGLVLQIAAEAMRMPVVKKGAK